MTDTTLTFNPEIGHESIQARILTAVKSGRLPHAFLFYGDEGAGKEAFAIELAKLLNCQKGPLITCQECSQCLKIAHFQHPDVKFVMPTPSSSNVKPETVAEILQEKAHNPYQSVRFAGKNSYIGIDTIRELKKEAKYKLYEGKKKVFIISQADQMRPEAANALLKLLEEPPDNLMLILITSRLHRILPTIRSRCQLVHFPPLPGDRMLQIIRKYHSSPPEHLSLIIRLSLGNLKLAFNFIENDVLEKREKAIEFLRKVVVIEKSQELLREIDQITAARDRGDIYLLLYFLLTWFRDAIRLKLGLTDPEHLINTDKARNLTGFVGGYPHANFTKCISLVEAAIADLEDARNLNPSLILMDLAIKLNLNIKKS